MDLIRNIYSAELKFRQPAEEFFIRCWGNTRLPSHDIDHHRRVWQYARELMLKTAEYCGDRFSFSPDQLLLACYFHDVGMSVDRGIKHGKHGKDIFLRFLSEYEIKAESFENALAAVENHDNKDYSLKTDPYDLITLLSASDDMDAFGYIGIFRYVEIYLNRDINANILGHLIRENAAKRFVNLARNYGYLDDLIGIHEKRYRILDEFFTVYTEQITQKESDGGNYHPACRLVDTIANMVKKSLSISDILNDPLLKPEDPDVINYLERILSESKPRF